MADLRARFATLDATPVPDLWPEVERRAAAGDTGTDAGGPVTVTGPIWRGSTPSASGSRRLVLVLVLLGLLVVTLLGAALVGAILPEPLRGQVPPAVTDETPDPTAEAAVLPEGVTAFPACAAGSPTAVPAGVLPESGTPIETTRNGRIAMAGEYGVYAVDPAADPPTAFGMAPPLARFPDRALVHTMAWSPDGRWLAFVVPGDGSDGAKRTYCQDVYVVSADGGVALNLTEHPAWTGVTGIAWSPDGQWLAYAPVDQSDFGQIFDPPESPASDPARSSIDIARLDDAMNVVERRRVWSGSTTAGPSWSTRGELAFASGDDGGLMVLDPGEAAVRETGAPLSGVSELSWAPDGDRALAVDGDGRLVIFHVHGNRQSSTEEVWRRGPLRVQGTTVVGTYVAGPTWTPDGRAIVMTVVSENETGRDSDIVQASADADEAVLRTLAAVDQLQPTPWRGPIVSPDGTLIAYSLDGVSAADVGVWVMESDGADQRRVSAPLAIGIAGPAAWQPLP